MLPRGLTTKGRGGRIWRRKSIIVLRKIEAVIEEVLMRRERARLSGKIHQRGRKVTKSENPLHSFPSSIGKSIVLTGCLGSPMNLWIFVRQVEMSFILIFIWLNVCLNRIFIELPLSSNTPWTMASPIPIVTTMGSRVGASLPSLSRFWNIMSSLRVLHCLAGVLSSIVKHESFRVSLSEITYCSISPNSSTRDKVLQILFRWWVSDRSFLDPSWLVPTWFS